MKRGSLFGAFALLCSGALAQPTIDGSLDASYGTAIAVQNTQTDYGNATLGQINNCDGSELDASYAQIVNNVLYVFIAGNLQSNGNRLWLFLDYKPGGQNRLRGDNAGNVVNMGDSGGTNGHLFDVGFDADQAFEVNCSGGTGVFLDHYRFPSSASGGTQSYLGSNGFTIGGTLTGGTNPNGILATLDNRNTAGVGSGTGTDAGLGALVGTGFEIAIPLSSMDWPVGAIRVSAFITNGSSTHVSNQVLGGIGGGANLGNVRSPQISFAGIAGNQYFVAGEIIPKLVVAKLGDGIANLTTAAAPITIEEYDASTPAQSAPVQALVLPATAAGSGNRALTVQGTAVSEGHLTRSDDGLFLTMAGYNASAGAAAPATVASSSINRVIGTISRTGTINTTTAFDAFSALSIRSSVLSSGTNVWCAGASGATGGSRYTTIGSVITPNQLISATHRVINIFDGQLYVSLAASVNTLGTGLPTGSVSSTALSGLTSTSIYDYWFADANTCYIADDNTAGAGIKKFTKSGSTWSLAYSMNSSLVASSKLTGICGYRDASGRNVLFATYYTSTSDSGLVKVTDTGAASGFTSLATKTSASKTAFRGVDFSILPSNSAPTLTVPANATINEGDNYAANATATDPDSGQTLTFSKVSGPAALTVSSGGAIAWTPGESDGGGVYTVTIKVEDNGSPVASDTESYTITVNEANQNPVLDNPGTQSASEGSAFSVQLTGSDADLPAQSLTYGLVSGPSGLSVSGSGLVTWTPGESDGGTSPSVTVSLSDSQATVQQTFTINVAETNENPVLADPTDHSVDEGVLDTVTLSATDADLPAQTLTYSLVSGPGAVVGNQWSWTPGESDGGTTATIVVKVEDNFSPVGSHTQSFQVTVNETNQPPVLTDPADHSVNEGVLDSVTLSATDADLPGQTLTYALVSGPGAVVGNQWSWTPGEVNGGNTYTVTVSVTDGTDTVQQSFDVTVNEVNQAPVLDDPADHSVNEHVLDSVTLSATDADLPGQTLTYALVSGPGSVTGNTWSWTPGEVNGGNIYTVTVSVTDGTDTVQQSFDVTVNETNENPVLADPADGSVDEGALDTRVLSATDADLPAQTLTYSLVSGPGSVTGNTWSWTPGESDGGTTATIVVKVEDNFSPVGSHTQSFEVTVNETNQAPVLTDPADHSVDEGVLDSVTLSASDADVPVQTLTYALVSGPGSVTGNTWTWTPGESDGPGVYNVTVSVTDGIDTVQQTFQVTVNEVNQLPVLDDPADQNIDEMVLSTVTLSASDADLPSQTLTYGLVSGPGAVAGNQWSWTPSETDGPGTYTVIVSVTDGIDTVQQSFDVNVAEANVAPVLNSIGAQSVDELQLLTFTATATDADVPVQTLHFSLAGDVPPGASITDAGVFTWTPTEAQGPGSYTFDVVVKDYVGLVGGGEDSETITVTVDEVNVAPVLAAIGNQSGTTTNLITFTATATDADLPANTLTFSLDAGFPAGASITSGGVFTWTPTNAQTGDFTVTVRVTDNGSPNLDDFETITIHVDASNTAPVADAQSVSTPKNTPLPITLTATDSDVPAQTLSYTVVDTPDHGVLSGTAPNLIYTPNANYFGPDSFTFKANDGLVDSNVATITIDVTQTPSMVISVYGSPAPNAFGSPSWPQYITNALTALETGASSVGDRNTDPSAYVQVTNAPWSDAVVSGFSSWRGVASALPPFDQEGGNRLHFGLRIQGNGTRFTLEDLEFAVQSDDPSNDLEFSGDFIGFNYSPTRKGIDYGPDRVKGTLDDITYTTGGGTSYVDEIIYVGVGNAWDASFETGTDQEKLEAVRCYLENLAPIHVLAEYKIKDGSGGYFATGSTVVTIIPTNSLPVANDQTVGVDEDSFVGITLTATDADNETLTYTVVDGPDHGSLSGTAPNLTYTPFGDYYGPDSFTFKATDCVGDSNIATVTINVANVNDDPTLGAIGNQTVDEQVNLTFNLSSSDIDGGAPSYSMTGGPAGATLVGNVFSWTPSEAQGPNVYSVTFEVSDGAGGVDSETISITVNEVNEVPVLGAIGTQTVDELQTLNFNATATDADLPANGLTFSLEGTVPPGATITSGGAFSWTPTEAQGPNSYTFDVVVKDDGSPQMEDRETITINVNEVNVAPVLGAIGNQMVDEMSLLTFTATATDSDDPANTLTFSLDAGAPAGASITSSGVFTWTPTEAQGPGVYSITVRVTDNGSPAMDDFETITVTVNEVPDAVSMTLNLSVPGFAGGGNVVRGMEIRVGGSGGANTPVVLDRDVTFDASGNATLVLTEADGLTAGSAYSFVSVRDPLHTIRRKVALNEASTDTYDATLSLMLGNLNKDNKVDIGDYVVFALRYGTTVVPDTPFDIPGNPPTHTPTFRHADLNGDGEVDIADYAILSASFGTIGDGDVGGWGRENNEIRQKISVLDAIVEAGTSDVVKFDQDGDGWITFKELGFHP
ncbi:MAG: tandem-95 repeat protein [Fimbriimonadaceae bacterium]|nr:tandem-95 repeat protein [Fimbriimonadaceae bacterium]